MKLRWPFQILLLSVLTLLIFYPTLKAEVSLIDDQVVITNLFNADKMKLLDLFVPRAEQGGYYRPFIGLSYYLDKVLWDLDIRSMHLDNILMHLLNVILLFAVLRLAVPDRKGPWRFLPLLGAALFAVHPISTESVNWISGRTDLMAGNFVLAAAALLLLYRDSKQVWYLLAAVICVACGIFSKEVAFGLVLGSFFILTARSEAGTDAVTADATRSPLDPAGFPFLLLFFALICIEVLYIGNYWFALAASAVYFLTLLVERREGRFHLRIKLRTALLFVGFAALVVGLYVLSRKIAFKGDVGKIGQTVRLMLLDLNYSISLFFGAAGFYFKKFILPLPLNFYIVEVDPLYDLAGILLLLISLRFMIRLRLAAAFFITGICLFLPALPFAFGTIAWTGYAERYIYLSSAFWIVAGAMWLTAHELKPWVHRISMAALSLVIVFFGWQTYARNLVWQKNLSLLEDTVRQSPRAKVLREMYTYAFFLAGNIAEAKRQYAIAASLPSLNYDGVADAVMATILTNEGDLEGALKLHEMAVRKSKQGSANILKKTVEHLGMMMGQEKDPQKKALLAAKLNKYGRMLKSVSADPMIFYNLGQNALSMKDKQAALDYFTIAFNSFDSGNPYKLFSGKLVTRLKKELP